MAVKHWLMTGAGSGLGAAAASPARSAILQRRAHLGPWPRIGRRQSSSRSPTAMRFSVDILVNNAGQVLESYVEEAPPERVRALFEVNLIGPLSFIQAILPAMRGRGARRIVNISSGGGISGVPAVRLYSASKFALEGMSEALAQEVGPLGIGVTIVEPGAFRTNLLGRNRVGVATAIADYDRSAAALRQRIVGSHGHEPGDPDKFGQAMLAVVDAEPAPLRVRLGDEGIAMALAKSAAIRHDVEAWRETGSNLAFTGARSVG